jgi:RNA 2',3'-cyclic 3'-phosphodiesterase
MSERQALGGQREETLRLFVAIELPEAWLAALVSAQEELRRRIEAQGGPGLRWTRPEGIHLTLKFLGSTPVSKLESVKWALASAVNETPDFRLTLGQPSHFLDRRGTRVALVTVAGDLERLHRLAEQIETWLASAGFPREKRGFRPHLTLARVPEEASRAERALVADALSGQATPSAPPLDVTGVSLMQSHLGPGGARYERLGLFPQPA